MYESRHQDAYFAKLFFCKHEPHQHFKLTACFDTFAKHFEIKWFIVSHDTDSSYALIAEIAKWLNF